MGWPTRVHSMAGLNLLGSTEVVVWDTPTLAKAFCCSMACASEREGSVMGRVRVGTRVSWGESRRRAVHVQEHKHGAMVRFIVVVVSNYFTGHGTPIASC